MNKKNVAMVLVFFTIIFTLMGSTLAYWIWTSSEKSVYFNTASGLENYIVYDEGSSHFIGNFQPTETFCESANTTISFYKTSDATDIDIYATINMNINSIGTNILASSDIYWVLTSGDNTISCSGGIDNTSEIISSGTFNSVVAGDTMILVNDLEVTTTEQSYTVWIWIDSNGTDLSLLSGETIDTNIWTQFDMINNNSEAPSLIGSYSCANIREGYLPYNFTYTGDCEVIDDGGSNWRVKFLTSGTFTPSIDVLVDTFLVGGGGAGGDYVTKHISGSGTFGSGGGGGGGGYDNLIREIKLTANNEYSIVVGAGGVNPSENGESSSAFGYSASGGFGGDIAIANSIGGPGGYGSTTGGSGGMYDESSIIASAIDGIIREFGESTGTIYGGSGAGGRGFSGYSAANSPYVSGGLGGGGGSNEAGVPNTGGGGGGGTASDSSPIIGQSGGSGIVIIRNSRYIIDSDSNSIPQFTYTGKYEIVNDNDEPIRTTEGNWKIRFLSSGKLTITKLRGASNGIDAFLVGGGGAGGEYVIRSVSGSGIFGSGGGGGGGGYTNTVSNVSLVVNTTYDIVVGAGGIPGSGAGGASSAFGYSASGGIGGNVAAAASVAGTGGSGSTTGGTGGAYSDSGTLPGDSTMREFGGTTGSYYGGAGAGGIGVQNSTLHSAYISGGLGGGGGSNEAGVPNTGGGGGGGTASGVSPVKSQYGGSGIVIIRNAR